MEIQLKTNPTSSDKITVTEKAESEKKLPAELQKQIIEKLDNFKELLRTEDIRFKAIETGQIKSWDSGGIKPKEAITIRECMSKALNFMQEENLTLDEDTIYGIQMCLKSIDKKEKENRENLTNQELGLNYMMTDAKLRAGGQRPITAENLLESLEEVMGK